MASLSTGFADKAFFHITTTHHYIVTLFQLRVEINSKRGFLAIYDNNDIYGRARQRMVETQLIPRGIKDQRVINAMLKVPRHLFVEEGLYDQAYNDYPLPIGEGQTISQPYMVALMTEALGLTSSDKIIEIGTGSGYQTAILSKLAGKVYSIERIPVLASKARKVLDYLSCPNVIVKISDGTVGWPEFAPFNGIIVAAASPALPEAYIEQMADDGVLIIPVGSEFDQNLMRLKKTPKGIVEDNLGGCKFVKLVGKFGWPS